MEVGRGGGGGDDPNGPEQIDKMLKRAADLGPVEVLEEDGGGAGKKKARKLVDLGDGRAGVPFPPPGFKVMDPRFHTGAGPVYVKTEGGDDDDEVEEQPPENYTMSRRSKGIILFEGVHRANEADCSMP